MLEEAGRMLRLQMTNAWTPTTSVNGEDSSAPDRAEEHGFNEPPRHQDPSTPTGIWNESAERQIPFRPSPTQDATPNGLAPTAPIPAVRARVIHGDVYLVPVTLRFDARAANTSIAVSVPGRATAAYAEPLTTTGPRPRAGGGPSGPPADRDSAGVARASGELRGGSSVGC
jgi:hypothetical protein